MEEIIDIYNRDGEHIWTATKSACHSKNPGFYHKPVWIWIINDKHEILVQKRTNNKKIEPNKWDMSCAGHVIAWEKTINGAIREVYEELWIETKEENYKFICEYIIDEIFTIAQIFLLKLNLEVNEFKLQKEEVAEIKWLTYDEFKKLFYSEDFVWSDDDYKELVLNIFKNEWIL